MAARSPEPDPAEAGRCSEPGVWATAIAGHLLGRGSTRVPARYFWKAGARTVASVDGAEEMTRA